MLRCKFGERILTMDNKDIMEYVIKLLRASRRHPGKRDEGRHLPHGVVMVLRVLDENGVMRSSGLAKKLDIRAASLSEILTKMEQNELIERKKDSNDSRIVNVSITEKGKAELKISKQHFATRCAKLETALTENERKHFAEICEKLIAFFESEASNKEERKEKRRQNKHYPRHDDCRGGEGGISI